MFKGRRSYFISAFPTERWHPVCSLSPGATALSSNQTRTRRTPRASPALTRSLNASSAPQTDRESWCSSSNGTCFLFSALFKALWVNVSVSLENASDSFMAPVFYQPRKKKEKLIIPKNLSLSENEILFLMKHTSHHMMRYLRL